ncbi:2-oxo acid dehydrogenase subunit E2 [Opacimonas viscosa]|uniref:Dihydrolipoamide acetyltransferase component of pyruvate dehydrogenase complex n=1 Tax=Opacimonas viscosa TaxID=2961944 RepID=A0AA41X051_9ALTE|nr:2-oxo acid dehydrogenase subunit E2 [Opacimonas viscosa]MCP3427533.1 2-oxo acid dehydrogenase subunit E2 [Opacimonas viscosa]
MQEFILPDIGEGIVECELLEWLVSEGQVIQEDDPVAEVMTDKATVQIPAMHSGTVAKLYYQVGDIAKVHAPLFALIPDEHCESEPLHKSDLVNKSVPVNKPDRVTNLGSQPPQSKVLASPAVRRIAKEQGINIQTVQGSGKKGRVLKEDLLEQNTTLGNTTERNPSVHLPNVNNSNYDDTNDNHTNDDTQQFEAQPAALTVQTVTADRVVPLRGMQAAMARHMINSVQTIPHFSVTDECAIQNLLNMQTALQPEFALHDIKLTLLPFMIKALSLALHKYPIINSQVSADMQEIIYKGQHNIGFAVDSPQGLLVPNIKDVAQKSLFEIAQQVQVLIKKAKAGELKASELQGGTITISNIGSIGGLVATPVINHPEVAIVAVGKIQRLPRFDEAGNIHSQAIMNVSWSGDHRIIDGATMVKFNNLWLKFLQHPTKMLAHLR